MKKLAIIGSGDLGQLMAYHAEADGHYSVAGFFDDFSKVNEKKGEIPVLGPVTDIESLFEKGMFDEVMIGIGYKHMAFRKKIYESLKGKIATGKIIHSSSFIDPSAKVGSGSFILPGCTLDRNVSVGENVLLNTGCVIAHDSKIESHTFLSPSVAVAGFVTINECCNIGINTTIIDNINISSGVQTGGGTVVIEHLTRPGLYVGNPARFIR